MTAKPTIKMQNDRRSGHLLQGFVKWLLNQRLFVAAAKVFGLRSFSSGFSPAKLSLWATAPKRSFGLEPVRDGGVPNPEQAPTAFWKSSQAYLEPSLIAARTSFMVPVNEAFPVSLPARVSMMSHMPLRSVFFRTVQPLMILSFFIFVFGGFRLLARRSSATTLLCLDSICNKNLQLFLGREIANEIMPLNHHNMLWVVCFV